MVVSRTLETENDYRSSPFKKSLQMLHRAPSSAQFNAFFILTLRLPKDLMTLKKKIQITLLILCSRSKSEISRE